MSWPPSLPVMSMKHPFLPTRPSCVEQVCHGAWQLKLESGRTSEFWTFFSGFLINLFDFVYYVLLRSFFTSASSIFLLASRRKNGIQPTCSGFYCNGNLQWVGFSSCARLTTHALNGCSGTHLSMIQQLLCSTSFSLRCSGITWHFRDLTLCI